MSFIFSTYIERCKRSRTWFVNDEKCVWNFEREDIELRAALCMESLKVLKKDEKSRIKYPKVQEKRIQDVMNDI